jgi:hypothetical protein
VGNTSTQELEGITLKVYLYVVKKRKPVGPRDLMRGANLSSPSVAYRHLQKLEDLNYLSKNEYGEYTIKRKAHPKGLVWVGNHLIPKMHVYASAFCTALVIELLIFAIHVEVETYEFKVFFLLLTLITGLASTVFIVEGFMQIRREMSNFH